MRKAEFAGRIIHWFTIALLAQAWSETTAQQTTQQARARNWSHFRQLPPVSIRPAGWFKAYALNEADGWPLQQARDRHPEIYGSHSQRLKFNADGSMNAGPDYAAYYGDGFIRLAHILPESKLAAELNPWLQRVLKSQDPDGYIGSVDWASRPKQMGGMQTGPYYVSNEWFEILDVFNQAVTIQALLHHYKVTHDEAVLEGVKRQAANLMQARTAKYKPAHYNGFVGFYVVLSMRELFVITGDPVYRDFARAVVASGCRVDEYLRFDQDKNTDTAKDTHSVSETDTLCAPAILYEITGEEKFLRASLNGWQMMSKYVAVDGQPIGNEFIKHLTPKAIAEHCTAMEWTHVNCELLRITGEAKFADAAERCLFNAYPAAKSTNSLTHAYMHSANELVATEWSHPHYDMWENECSREYYSSAHSPLCCNVISHRALPYFLDNSVFTRTNGLVVALYAPIEATAQLQGGGKVRIKLETAYPFADSVTIKMAVDQPAAFPVYLRIPGWCSSVKMSVNGQPASTDSVPGTFIAITRDWRSENAIKLDFSIPPRLVKFPSWPRQPCVAIQRGPLTFALPVKEKWVKAEDLPKGNGHFQTTYRVFTDDSSVWNYALLLDERNLQGSVELVPGIPVGSRFAWGDPPVCLLVAAKRVLNWAMEGSSFFPLTPSMPVAPMKLASETETVRLVPFGCTRLRMAYLPFVQQENPRPAATKTNPVQKQTHEN